MIPFSLQNSVINRFFSSCTLSVIKVFVENSNETTAVRTDENYENFLYAVNNLKDCEFILCSTVFEKFIDDSFQGGQGHVFVLLKNEDNILWIEANRYPTHFFEAHTAEKWFDETIGFGKELDEEQQTFYDENVHSLREWKKRGNILIDCIKYNKDFVYLFIGNRIIKHSVRKLK